MYLCGNIYEDLDLDLDLDLGVSKPMCKCSTDDNTTTTAPIPTSAVIRRRRSMSMINNKNEKSNVKAAAAPPPNSKTCRVKSQKKTRKKPKFLSLKRQLRSIKHTAAQNQRQGQIDIDMSTPALTTDTQLNLFPLHPEDRDDNMAYFFSAADGGASTLTGLLDDAAAAAAASSSGVDASPSGEDVKSFSESPSLTYACDEENEGELVRTAIRSKERDASEERWVRYSEVVERKEEEVSSCCCASAAEVGFKMRTQRRRLSLKLDYQEIMNAWSDKGPLYVPVDSPQTVPDLLHEDEFLALDLSSCPRESWGGNGGLWRVPEMSIRVKEEVQPEPGGDDYWRIGQREASVLRYKEKRQSRLFAKKIRYEVRKLNAEKRPRIKGRFVKRG